MSHVSSKILISICIPSYNRPTQLVRLLESVDCTEEDVEIVICEDRSPKRREMRAEVEKFKSGSRYCVRYHENKKNLGFDGNIRELVRLADGHFIIFMGDDDLFLEGMLDRYKEFLRVKYEKKYVLRSYVSVHPDGTAELFKYMKNSTDFLPSQDVVAWLFKRSVSLAGFTIASKEAKLFCTDELDGTLLYQVFLMAQVCLRYEASYCDFPVVHAVQSFRLDKPHFGAAESEKQRYVPGVVSESNSVNFTAAYFEVTRYFDRLNGTDVTNLVRQDLSKYSYPFLSIQRKRGIKSFLRYAKRLEKELLLGCTPYFHLYKWSLVILNEKICDIIIVKLKTLLGRTPQL